MSEYTPRKWILVNPDAHVVGSFQTERELVSLYNQTVDDIEFVPAPNPTQICEVTTGPGLRAFPCNHTVYDYFCLKNAPPFLAKRYLMTNQFGVATFDTGESLYSGKQRYKSIAVAPFAYQHLKALTGGRGFGPCINRIIREYITTNQKTLFDPVRQQYRASFGDDAQEIA